MVVTERTLGKTLKKLEKVLKKGLTKGKSCVIITRSLTRRRAKRPGAEPETSIRSLKIEQQNFEHKNCVKESRKHIE